MYTRIYLHSIRVVPFRHLGEQIARICWKLVGNWWTFSPNYGGNIATVTWLRTMEISGWFGMTFEAEMEGLGSGFPKPKYSGNSAISSALPWRLFFRLLFLLSPNNYRKRWENRHVQMALWQEYQCILWGDLMIVAYHSALWWYYVSIK